MIDPVLGLSNGKLAAMKARGVLLRKALAEPGLFIEMLRLEPYLKRVLAERYWLEEALEHKDEVMSFLNGRQSAEALHAFRE